MPSFPGQSRRQHIDLTANEEMLALLLVKRGEHRTRFFGKQLELHIMSLKMHVSCNPVISLLGIHPKEMT